MKKRIYAICVLATLGVIVDAGFIKSARGNTTSPQYAAYITHSEEFPQWLRPHSGNVVRQSFELDIPSSSSAISQIDIAIPDGLKVSNKITVSNSGQDIDAKVSINDNKIIIDFPQTVSSGAKLKINMNKVKMVQVRNYWIYRVSIKPVGNDVEIPVGEVSYRAYL